MVSVYIKKLNNAIAFRKKYENVSAFLTNAKADKEDFATKLPKTTY